MRMVVKVLPGFLIQYIAALAGVLSIIPVSSNYGWSSPYLPKLLDNSSTIPTTSEEGSWCVTLPLLFAPLGAVIGSMLLDKIGRKMLILSQAPLEIICLLALGYSSSIWELTGLRCCLSAIDGLLFTVVPAYIAEISEPKRRGVLSSFISLSCILGILIICVLGPFFTIFESSLIITVFPLVHMVIFIFMPESPYYYIKKHRLEDAEKSLKMLRGNTDIREEFEDLCKAVKRQEEIKVANYIDLVTVPSNREATIIFLILCLATKLSGKSPLVFYSQIIFRETGSSLSPAVSVILFQSIELGITTLVVGFVDKFGKSMIVISSVGCTTALFVLDVHLILNQYDFYKNSFGWMPLIALFSFNIFFSIGLSYSQMAVAGELFPTNIKGKALCASESFSTILAAVVSKFFQVTNDAFGIQVPFLFFLFCSATSSVLIVWRVPDTKGKTLEEIQLYFLSKSKKKCSPDPLT